MQILRLFHFAVAAIMAATAHFSHGGASMNALRTAPRSRSPTDAIKAMAALRYIPIVPILLGLIMVGGLLIRLIFFAASAPLNGAPLLLDEGNYLGIAEALYRGEGFREGTPWRRPPAYPVFLAIILTLSGGSRTAVLLAQMGLSVANIGVAYALAREVFALRPDVPHNKAKAVGLVSASLMAANPHVASQAGMFMVETLYMLLISLLFWIVLRVVRALKPLPQPQPETSRRIAGLIVIAGLIAAVGALTRSQLLSFVPLLLAWLWWVLSRSMGGRSVRALMPAALFVCVMLAAILPWTIRNYLRYDRFLLIETTGGYNLWLYNDIVSRDEINRRLMEIPNPVDRESYTTQQATQAIWKDPLSFAASASQRFADSWSVEQFSDLRFSVRDKYPGTDCTVLDLYAWTETLFYVAFGFLTIWGFVLAPGRALKGLFLLFLLHYAIVTMLTFSIFRFRMPLYPLAGIFAAYAVVSLAGWLRGRIGWHSPAHQPDGLAKSSIRLRYLSVGVAGMLSILFVMQCATIALPGLLQSIRYERRYLSGKNLLDKRDYVGALANFTGAAEIDHSCACLYRNIGLAHAGLGEPDEERAAYQTAIVREANDWRARPFER